MAKHDSRVVRRFKNPLYYMYHACKSRCKKKGIQFSITMDDLGPLPSHCPVLGIPMTHNLGGAMPDSYSIDRIVPSRGYVPGNVRIISYRANTIKTNASPDELGKVAADYLRLAKANNIPFTFSDGATERFSFDGEPSAKVEAEIVP